jgi:hypothetical protein
MIMMNMVHEAMDEIASLHRTIRGLESQICTSLSSPRKQRVTAVLQVQEEMRQQKQQQQHPISTEDNDSKKKKKNDAISSNSPATDDTVDDEMNHDYWLERIRQASMAVSLPNRNYATYMGEFDHIEGLKASLSRWRKKG